jgi:hypothetical protein
LVDGEEGGVGVGYPVGGEIVGGPLARQAKEPGKQQETQ